MLNKAKKTVLIFIFIIIAALLLESKNSFAADSVENKAKSLVDGLADNLTESPLSVTIGKLTIENSNFSSEFAENFLRLVEFNMNNHKLDFKKVKRMLTTRGGLLLKKDNDKQKTKAVKDVTLEGSYRINEKTGAVYITARLVDKRGLKISSYDISISSSSIKLELKPPNLEKIKKAEKEISDVPSKGEDFNIDVWIDKGNGGIYKKGEKLHLMVRVGEDSYIKVLYIDVSGNHILMYPTERDPNVKLKRGEIYELHERNSYTVQSPFGSEMIIAFASTIPFKNTGEKNIGGGYRGFDNNKTTSEIVGNLRSIGVTGNTNDENRLLRAEARVYLTTVKNH